MAPMKPSKGKAKGGKPTSKSGGASKKATKGSDGPTGISKRKAKSMALAKPGGAQKTKSIRTADGKKKKKRVYTEAELDIPKLNSIIPAGIAKPKGQKKGKKFVDDPESMMAIMSMVNAEKEGHLESKIMRARQLEEVREAKRKEQEKKSEERAAKFEEKKNSLKKTKKRRHTDGATGAEDVEEEGTTKTTKKNRKRVSFG